MNMLFSLLLMLMLIMLLLESLKRDFLFKEAQTGFYKSFVLAEPVAQSVI